MANYSIVVPVKTKRTNNRKGTKKKKGRNKETVHGYIVLIPPTLEK